MTAQQIRNAWATTANADVRSVAWALGVSADELLRAMVRLDIRLSDVRR